MIPHIVELLEWLNFNLLTYIFEHHDLTLSSVEISRYAPRCISMLASRIFCAEPFLQLFLKGPVLTAAAENAMKATEETYKRELTVF